MTAKRRSSKKPPQWIQDYGKQVWRLTTKSLTRGVVIHKHIDHPPDQWLFSADDLGIQTVKLKSKDIEKAKKEVVTRLMKMLLDVYEELDETRPRTYVS